ncbi:MAG TPA: peptidylprolyl isomerase [Polyangiaceae bacterium]
MLSFFRGGGIGNVVVAGIAFAIIVVFALEFRTGNTGTSAKLSRECAVEFGGYCVDAKEFYAAHGVVVPRGVEPKMSKQLSLNKKVLDGLVERELLVAEAHKLGLAVGDDALEADLIAGRVRASLPAETLAGGDQGMRGMPDLPRLLGLCRPSGAGYQCAPGTDYPVRQLQVSRTEGEPFDYKLYEKQIRLLTNRGPKEFREMQERELLAARMRDIVRSRVRIPDPEAFLLFERDRTKLVVRSVSLSRDWFAKYAVALDDAAISKWSLANQAQVDADWTTKKSDWVDGCALASELFVELPSAALDDEKVAARQKAEKARERLTKGEDFETVAREVSQGPTAILGGRLGCLGSGYGIGADELKKAAESLKPGELSTVIESPRGFHVLRVTGKLGADKLEASGRQYVAARLYARFAADEALQQFAEQLITRAKAGEKLEDATRALAVEVSSKIGKPAAGAAKPASADTPALLATDRPQFEVSAPFNASGNPLPDLSPNESLAAKAFELKQADEVYAKPLGTATGAVVLQLKERSEASHDDFLKDKARVVQALLQAKSGEALARYVQDLRRAAGEKLVVMSQFGEETKGRVDEQE